MFNKKNYKRITVTILALTMILGTVALAAEGIYTKQLKATYGSVKFNFEGVDVTNKIESKYNTPGFIVENRSYVPVRAIADLLGVDIDYVDGTVMITDPKEEEHRKQLVARDIEIAKLKGQIDELKEEVKEDKKEEITKKDLKTLQGSLNKTYSEYEKIEFDILLKEDKTNKITIDITTNLANTSDKQNWIRMKYSDKKYLMEDVVDQVKKEFKDADISGNIYDSFSRKNLYTFRLNKSGTVSITNLDYVSGGYYDDRYYDDRYYDGTADSFVYQEFLGYGIKGARLYDSSRYSDSFEIYFPVTDENTTKWDSFKEGNVEISLDSISRKIEYDYNLTYGRDMYIDIKNGSTTVGTYRRDMRYNSPGTFTYID